MFYHFHYGIHKQFIAVTRDPSVLNTSGATTNSASQNSGETATSQDKAIKGAKFIALTAENSNLKALVNEVTPTSFLICETIKHYVYKHRQKRFLHKWRSIFSSPFLQITSSIDSKVYSYLNLANVNILGWTLSLESTPYLVNCSNAFLL